MRRCTRCGSELNEQAKVCPVCGTPVDEERAHLRRMVVVMLVAAIVVAAAERRRRRSYGGRVGHRDRRRDAAAAVVGRAIADVVAHGIEDVRTTSETARRRPRITVRIRPSVDAGKQVVTQAHDTLCVMGKCKTLTVNGTPYDVLRLLGKGNGGYSFLVRSQTHPPVLYVLKQIHYGPYDYYQYDDKMQAEIRDYRKLRELGVKLPAMLDIGLGHDRILKEYVDGPTIYELVLADQMQDDYLEQIRRLAKRLAAKRLNINYFPTNFVVEDGVVHYIDFECKPYKDTWDFENWGVKYWSKTPEFLAYVAEHTQRDPQGAGAEG